MRKEENEEVKKALKHAGATIVGAIVSKIVKNINYVIVFIIGVLIGMYIMANNINKVGSSYTGCLFLCTYSPIYTQYGEVGNNTKERVSTGNYIRPEDLDYNNTFKVDN